MIISHSRFIFLFSWVRNVVWDRLKAKFQECFEFITFHFSSCCILSVKTMLNNRETARKKSTQYNVKWRHYKWLFQITENLLKNLTNFSSTHVRICAKDDTPLVGYRSWINIMPKIRAFYIQALKLTLVFASLFFETERNLETPDSSVFVDQGAGAFPRNRRTPYILMFLRKG